MAESDIADQPVPRVDNEYVIEIVRQIVAFAQKIDYLANIPERRHGHEFALHQTAGALFGESQAFFEHRA